MNNTIIKIATHNGVFHADEITAIALLVVFNDVNYIISRLTHQSSNFEDYDYVIDIGRIFDDVKYFDHHQWKGGQSSAGLIWNNIQNKLDIDDYPEISELVELIDSVDVGDYRSKPYEYPALVSGFNHHEPYQEIQLSRFHDAVSFAITTISSMKRKQDDIYVASNTIESYINANEYIGILKFDKYVPYWNYVINGENTSSYSAVYWPNDEGTFSAQVVPMDSKTNAFFGYAFLPDDSMEFVHSNGFYCVAKTEEIMVNYLQNNITLQQGK